MHNRLGNESSSYLLQHAHNPVDWFPWGEEAFEKAKLEDKPVFLSIGYSSCHWCHVMAHECFEDDEVASLMNDTFVNVKVDREELPHIDHIYMQACQVLTGSGGWPLTIVMTPEKEPFFAATYLPKHSRSGLMGMMDLVRTLGTIWRDKRDRVISEAAEITQMVRRSGIVRPGPDMNPKLLDQAYEELKSRFDSEQGGFGTAPKFPMPQTIMFLLRYHYRTKNKDALDMAFKTLHAMHAGGMYDHVGFGFHRYATDDKWLVPHFEKMLYDQALLTMAYTEAFQVTGSIDFRRVANEIITYVLRDLRTPEGLFASAQDADSQGEEGKYYLWRTSEVRAILGDAEYALASQAFGLRENGNFPFDPSDGLNIIHQGQDLAALAAMHGTDSEIIAPRLQSILSTLREARSHRIPPMKDTKALTDWNGLMIAALAKAGAAFSTLEYIEAAQKAADFILEKMLVEGRLSHVFVNGKAERKAGLDDYAFLIWGLIELYEAAFEEKYLASAINLAGVMIDHFWDSTEGGFFAAADDTDVPIARTKTGYDNAIPSGNSVAMLDLLRLGGLTGDHSYKDRANMIGKTFSGQASHIPTAFTFMLCGLGYMEGPAQEVVIAGDPAGNDTREMINALQRRFLPHASIMLGTRTQDRDKSLTVQGKRPLKGSATAYVCTGSTCLEPTTEIRKMLEFLTINR